MRISFVFPPAWAAWAPSYGMALLAATCRKAGHKFRGFDCNIDMYHAVDPSMHELWKDDGAPSWSDPAFIERLFTDYRPFLERYVDDILANDPELVALSVQTASTLFGLALARMIRARRPNLFILFGGPDCFPSERGLSLLDEDCVSAICAGEGDEVLPPYLKAIAANNMRPVEMAGFCHRRADGTIFDGGHPPAVMDLDAVPAADFSGIDFSRYTLDNRICMMTSRGCILRCSFCSEGENFLRYRYRSPESLVAEVARHVCTLILASGKKPHINFSDSLINGRPEALERFCHLILEKKLEFTWGGMALLRKEMTFELLSLMRRAGCVELMWGMESGSHATLKLMRKKLFDPALAEQIVKDAHRLGIDQYTNIIVGFPGETQEMFDETTRFVRKIHPYFRSIGLPLMEIRRNTHVHDNPDKYGVLTLDSMGWTTKDGTNNLEVRLARRKVLSAILEQQLFEQGRYRALEA